MRYSRVLVSAFVFIFIFQSGMICAQQSPDDSRELYAMARDLWVGVELQSLGYVPQNISAEESGKRLRQASLYLQAAIAQDQSDMSAWNDLFVLLSTDAINDPGRALDVLAQYSGMVPDDDSIVQAWIKYRLKGLNDRRTREYFLDITFPAVQDYPEVQSDVITQLGVLAFEKGDTATSRSHFAQAIQLSLYNDDALARYLQLPLEEPVINDEEELTPEQVENREKMFAQQREQQLENRKNQQALLWRTRLRKNPYDLDVTMNLIDTLMVYGEHKLAQDYYNHAYKLLSIAAGDEGLEYELRLKHYSLLYRSGQYRQCIQIAQAAVEKNPDDLLFNGLMAKAIQKLGVKDEADRIIKRITSPEFIDESQLSADQKLVRLEALSWIFSFLWPDPGEALKYAREVIAMQEEVSRGQEVLAYAYVLNGEPGKAKELLEGLDVTHPVVSLAWGKIYLEEDNPSSALESLQGVDDVQAGFLYEDIQSLINQIQPDPNVIEASGQELGNSQQQSTVEMIFQSRFDDKDLLIPSAPERYVGCFLKLRKDIYGYGDPILAQIYLNNKGDIDLRLGPDSFLDPHVLIVAEVSPVSGQVRDVSSSGGAAGQATVIVLSHRYLLQKRTLQPRRSSSVTEALNINELRRLLEDHPQQSYKIQFHAYLDPVVDAGGGAVKPNPGDTT